MRPTTNGIDEVERIVTWFKGRPSASPVMVALVATGVIHRRHRILDVGCGTAQDALALASWGFHHVHALDEDTTAARSRARYFFDRTQLMPDGAKIQIHRGSATELHECFRQMRFDVVLDGLLWNNIAAQSDDLLRRYLRNIWSIMKPGGLFVVQSRSTARHSIGRTKRLRASSLAARLFTFSPILRTHLAEFTAPTLRAWERGVREKDHCPIDVFVGRARVRPR